MCVGYAEEEDSRGSWSSLNNGTGLFIKNEYLTTTLELLSSLFLTKYVHCNSSLAVFIEIKGRPKTLQA